MKTISEDGLHFIEKWEELVLYVYDDKVPKRKINGVRKYPEWDGSEVIGTLTIGYGHTDAAGWPKIVKGLRVTKEESDEILAEDLKDCIRVVNSLKLPLTQHEFDALVSFMFNCGEGNLRRMISGTTVANYKVVVPRRLMQYVTSKGERMQGLVNRRAGEIQFWNQPDDDEDNESMPLPSTADREEAPKSMSLSKTGAASKALGAAGLGISLSGVNDASSALKETKANFADLGVFDYLSQALHTPYFWVGLLILALGGFVYWDRHVKLTQEHV